MTIGTNVTYIGNYAFSDCTSLINVTIGKSVQNIANYAFFDCTSLTSVTIPNRVSVIGEGAFGYCISLANVMIGTNVTSIANYTFFGCTSLTSVYFQGKAPSLGGSYVLYGDNNATVYYLPGTTGWGSTFGGRPTALWRPLVQTRDGSFGVRTNQFGFNIAWASGRVIVVEACTNLANPVWSPIGTNTLTNGCCYFCDPRWTNYPARFYHVRWP